MSFVEFARLVRSGNGYFKALIEREQGRPLTDGQVRGLYRTYLIESGYAPGVVRRKAGLG